MSLRFRWLNGTKRTPRRDKLDTDDVAAIPLAKIRRQGEACAPPNQSQSTRCLILAAFSKCKPGDGGGLDAGIA